MHKTIAFMLTLALAGCAGFEFRDVDLSAPCATRPGSYDCQIERYTRSP